MNKNKLLILLVPTLLSGSALMCAAPASKSNLIKTIEEEPHITRTIYEAVDTTPSDEKVTIHILHQEDYLDESLLDAFMERYPNCKVVFDKTDTNETLYNMIQTGKSEYNVVTCSEYMIQRLASEDMILKISNTGDKAHDDLVDALLSNANNNVSHWLSNPERNGMVDKINVYNKKTKEKIGVLSDYTVGYMWGTLGTVVNPYYNEYVKRGMDKDYIVDGLRGDDGWSKFWDKEYKGTHSIKESMRDTYALGIFEVFKDQFLDVEHGWTREYKNDTFFNDSSKETIKLVKDSLIDLKGNIFGFEVDSGKNDIVTGKIGMNLAWSGDAAFSILKGQYYPGPDENYDEEKPDDKKTYLYYNIPNIGANVWFDGFAMPKMKDPNYVGSEEYKYTLRFLDFISEAESVVANMSTTGFTSFMSGVGSENNPIVDFIFDTFVTEDPKATVPYDISYFFNGVDSMDMTIMVDPDSYEGRLLVAQYPEKDMIDRLYIMEDYGENNQKIVQMWEDIKVNPLPIWIVVCLIVFVVVLLGYLGSYKLIKAYKVKKRKELRNKPKIAK